MIKVVNLNNSFKHVGFFIMISILIIIIFLFQKNCSSLFIENNHKINTIFFACLEDILPPIDSTNTDKNNVTPLNQFILYSEFPILNTSLLKSSDIIKNSSQPPSESEPKDTIELASGAMNTEPIENSVTNTYTNNYNGVQIKNTSVYELNDDMINPSSLDINKQNIIIFHTHTCESYTQSDAFQYEESGNFRTLNLERSVAKVGSSLTDYLMYYGFNVIHNIDYHDYPSYSSSYERSMETVQSMLANNPDTDIIIDVHRDAIADGSYAPTVKIGDETVSQLMFVLGTDGGGLEHPNWVNNLKFAVKVQEKANELYPGLFKPIIVRNSRYNQQLGKAACIIEVGATGNTLDQSIASMKYLSYVLNEVLK